MHVVARLPCTWYLARVLEFCVRNCLSDWSRESYVASWVGSWLAYTDASVGLLLGQTRGITPSPTPLLRAGVWALICSTLSDGKENDNIIQPRKKAKYKGVYMIISFFQSKWRYLDDVHKICDSQPDCSFHIYLDFIFLSYGRDKDIIVRSLGGRTRDQADSVRLGIDA